jgi:hypothetical protein
MRRYNLLWGIILGVSLITLYALNSPVAEIDEQSKKLGSSETQLKETITQLKGVHDDLVHSVNDKIQSTIHTLIDSQIGTLRSTQDQLNKIPDAVLAIFDSANVTGLKDAKDAVGLIIDTLTLTKNILNGVQTEFADTIKRLEYNPSQPTNIYHGLEEAIKFLDSAYKDLQELKTFLQQLGI